MALAERPQAARAGRLEGLSRGPTSRSDLRSLPWSSVYIAPIKTGERRSLREISADLIDAGYVNEYGKPYPPQSIQRMIDGDRPTKNEEGDKQ